MTRVSDFLGTSKQGRATPHGAETAQAAATPPDERGPGESGETPALPPSGWCLPANIEHFSASSLAKFQKCPLQWQEHYLRGNKGRAGAALIVGGAFHQVVEEIMRLKIMSGQLALEPVSDFAAASFDAKVEEQGGKDEVDWGQTSFDKAREQIPILTRTYLEKVGERIEPEAVEHNFGIRLPGLEHIPVIGFVDIVQKEGRPLIDMKTSARKVIRVQPEWWLQDAVYQIALDRTVDWHVVTKTAEPAVYTGLDESGLLSSLSSERKQYASRLIVQLAWQINSFYAKYGPDEDWPTRVSSQACGTCHHKPKCPAWS